MEKQTELLIRIVEQNDIMIDLMSVMAFNQTIVMVDGEGEKTQAQFRYENVVNTFSHLQLIAGFRGEFLKLSQEQSLKHGFSV